MDRISLLNIFLRVAQTESFTKAADSMELTRSRITRAVKTLESDLGVQLFNRTTRKVTLTTAGSSLKEKAQQLVNMSDSLFDEVRAASGQDPSGRLRISSTVIIAWVFVQQAVLDFHRLYPRITIELITEDRDLDLMERGIDLAFKVGNQLSPGYVARNIGSVRSYLAATPQYLASHFVPEIPSDLEKLDFLQNRYLGDTVRLISDEDLTQDLRLHSFFICNNAFLNLNACLLGLGVAMLPRDYIQPFLDTGKLVRVLPRWEGEPYGFHAISATRHLSTPAKLFLSFVKERLQTKGGRVYAFGLP